MKTRLIGTALAGALALTGLVTPAQAATQSYICALSQYNHSAHLAYSTGNTYCYLVSAQGVMVAGNQTVKTTVHTGTNYAEASSSLTIVSGIHGSQGDPGSTWYYHNS